MVEVLLTDLLGAAQDLGISPQVLQGSLDFPLEHHLVGFFEVSGLMQWKYENGWESSLVFLKGHRTPRFPMRQTCPVGSASLVHRVGPVAACITHAEETCAWALPRGGAAGGFLR